MLAIRLIVTGGLLALLLPRIHLGSIDWGASTVAWLAAGLLATSAGIVLSALRWQRVLVALGLHPALRRLLDHYLAAPLDGTMAVAVATALAKERVLLAAMVGRAGGTSEATVAAGAELELRARARRRAPALC